MVFCLQYFGTFTVEGGPDLCLSSSIGDVSNSVHLPPYLARPRSPLFVAGLGSVISCTLFSALKSGHEVLWNVLDVFSCVIVWCVAIPTYSKLGSTVMLPVIDQFTDHIPPYSALYLLDCGTYPSVFRPSTELDGDSSVSEDNALSLICC